MKKQYRIKKSQDFKKVLDYRHLAGKNDSVAVYYAPNEIDHARIGISVSKKIGDAVTRARIRRQIRAMVNSTGILSCSYDIIIIARSGFRTKTFQDNLAGFDATLTRLKTNAKGEKQ